MSVPHALILAGGRGERLGGVRKADLKIGGVRLIDRVIAALQPVQSPVLVSIGHGGGAWAGTVSVADFDVELGGPLAGIAAGVDYLAAHGIIGGLLVTAAADTPFMPRDFIAVMEESLGDSSAAFAGWGESFYPTSAMWRLEALQALPAQVKAGTSPHSPKALLEKLGATRVDWMGRENENPFANLNTMGDLVALGRRATDR